MLLVFGCSDTQAPAEERFEDFQDEGQSVSIPPTPASLNSSITLNNTFEPNGFAVISERTLNAKVEGGWTDRGDAAFSIVAQNSAPRSPNSIGQARFKKGYRGGGGPISTSLNLNRKKKKELYLSFWMKVSSNFYGSTSSGSNKVYHIWIDGTSKVVFALYGQGMGGLKPQMRLQNIDSDPRGISFNLNPNLAPGVRINRDQWHHVEISLKANTPGKADGSIAWWIDGLPAGSDSRVGYVAARNSPYWQQVSWAPTWGGPQDRVPATQYMYMDHIYVSGK
jgi:hypothetical protein